jgi:hypothetical protein
MAELIAVSELLATLPALPAGVNMASMNISGGETGIMADVAALFGLSFPDFSPKPPLSCASCCPITPQ